MAEAICGLTYRERLQPIDRITDGVGRNAKASIDIVSACCLAVVFARIGDTMATERNSGPL